MNTELTQERLKSLLRYDPDTGNFKWIVHHGGNATIGRIAGTVAICGRIYIKIDDKSYQAHRLAFLFMNGEFPSDQIDHIDRDPTNNKWVNLRTCSRAENGQNRVANKTNRSGLLGVSHHGNAWCAEIKVNKKRIYLGRFADPKQAHEVYLAAKAKFHTFQPKPLQEDK